MISLPPVPQQEEESSTELASQEQETKEDSAPVAAGESSLSYKGLSHLQNKKWIRSLHFTQKTIKNRKT